MIKVDDKRIKFSPINGATFFPHFHIYMNRSKNMLKNLKIIGKKVSLPFNLPSCLDFYVYEYELKHVMVKTILFYQRKKSVV